MSDDCSMEQKRYQLFSKNLDFEIDGVFVDSEGIYHGISRSEIESIFNSADIFIDMGTHGLWLEEAAKTSTRIFIDTEPGYQQMKWDKAMERGKSLPEYDYYYSPGHNIGTSRCSAPTAGRSWRHVFNPVVIDLYPLIPVEKDAIFTTVMNWQGRKDIEYKGVLYGQKDVEFQFRICLALFLFQ
jgi:hypothetical protein